MRVHHAVEQIRRLVSVCRGFIFPWLMHHLQALVIFLHLPTGPSLNGRATPGRMHNTHRHLQFLMQRARKKIRSARKAANCLRGALRPFAVHSRLRLQRRLAGGGKHAYVTELGGGLFLFKIATLRNRPGHVRLSGGKPHFAHEYFLEANNVFARHLEKRTHIEVIDSVQSYAPFAVQPSYGALGLPGKLHRHLFTRCSRAPHRCHRPALQNHIIAKYRRQRHLRLRYTRAQAKNPNHLFHIISRISIPALRPALRDIFSPAWP